MRVSRRAGMTLMEILTVVAILAVLAVLGATQNAKFTMNARKAGCLSNQASIVTALGVWETRNSTFPEPTTGS